MFNFQAYIDRVKPDGISFQTDISDSTKRQAYEYMMNSPSLTSTDEMELEEQSDKTYEVVLKESRPSIVSDIDSFYKRAILFTPDTEVKLGTYMNYKNVTYLITKTKGNEIYPEVEIEFCNYDFPIEVEKERVEVDRDEFGKPIYELIGEDYSIPSVATSKIYSALDNSQMPLPVGALYVYVPYHKDVKIPINYEFVMYGDTYQVTSAPKTHLLKDENGELYGYLELRSQRKDDIEKGVVI